MPRRTVEALERKRVYNRERNRRLRGTASRGEGDSKGKGVVPRENVVPPIREGNVVPIPMNPRTMSKKKLVEYLAHVGQRGFTLVSTSRGYELVANTGQLVPFDGVAVLESTLKAHGQRITQLEADLTRLEMMMDSMLREGDLS